MLFKTYRQLRRDNRDKQDTLNNVYKNNNDLRTKLHQQTFSLSYALDQLDAYRESWERLREENAALREERDYLLSAINALNDILDSYRFVGPLFGPYFGKDSN